MMICISHMVACINFTVISFRDICGGACIILFLNNPKTFDLCWGFYVGHQKAWLINSR